MYQTKLFNDAIIVALFLPTDCSNIVAVYLDQFQKIVISLKVSLSLIWVSLRYLINDFFAPFFSLLSALAITKPTEITYKDDMVAWKYIFIFWSDTHCNRIALNLSIFTEVDYILFISIIQPNNCTISIFIVAMK